MKDIMLAALQFPSPFTATAVGLLATGLLIGFGLLRWWNGPPAAVSRRWGLLGLRIAAIATLIVIMLNPSDVNDTPGPIDRPDVFYLLDSSQSMALGDTETRFDHALRLMREADQKGQGVGHAGVKLFRFGNRLAAVDGANVLGLGADDPFNNRTVGHGHENGRRTPGLTSEVLAAEASRIPTANSGVRSTTKPSPLLPTDADTQLLTALRQVSSRFGRKPPAGIVLFSDGRARDESGVEALASQFAKLKVPVHVVPVGDNARGGDVAIVACVVPPRARRFAEVEVQVFLRSYGYDGRRCEVSLTVPGNTDEEIDRPLATPVPVTLHDGFQTVNLSFRTDAKTNKLKVAVSKLPNELSSANNVFQAEVQIDRTKIRVLYIEGSSQPLQSVQTDNVREVRGPYSDLQQALVEDEDIECVVLHSAFGRGRLVRVLEAGHPTTLRGFPETVAELSAFDAIILSDIGSETFTEQQLEWIDKWIGQRGGGLMMVGGRRSFSAGSWEGTPLAEMLPVLMNAENDWLPGTQITVQAEPQAISHPLWAISADETLNREIVGHFPSFFGSNRWAGVKPNLTRVLATSNIVADSGAAIPAELPGGQKSPEVKDPAVVIGKYGRGRTMAMSMPITSPWANEFLFKWGGDKKNYGKFWRNAVYWLTESSSIGRRRLVVTADKKFYRPGEIVTLTAAAFDEATNQTGAYKITSMVEPKTSLNNLESNYSSLRWPEGKPRESGETSPFIAWGEEFDLPRVDTAGGKPAFSLELPIADALTGGSASQSLRVELTAMEDFTQVDSTSVDIQILHDPFEQQNPFPNHELLATIAQRSGGQVIQDAAQLAEVLREVPMTVGAPIVNRSPLWSTWWIWYWLLGVMSLEWIWRRYVGLA